MCAIRTGETRLVMHQMLNNGKDIATCLSRSLSSATDHIMACQDSRRQPSLHLSRPLPFLFARRFFVKSLIQATLTKGDTLL